MGEKTVPSGSLSAIRNGLLRSRRSQFSLRGHASRHARFLILRSKPKGASSVFERWRCGSLNQARLLGRPGRDCQRGNRRQSRPRDIPEARRGCTGLPGKKGRVSKTILAAVHPPALILPPNVVINALFMTKATHGADHRRGIGTTDP
jgi:hypothetical protein